MMLANVATKAIDDRWRGMVIGVVIVAAMLALGMAAYQQVDLTLYNELPEAMRSLMGIPDNADVAALAYGVMYAGIAAMTVAGISLSIGASGIAGEERDGTIGLLLASPRSRTDVLVAKSVAMVAIATLGALLLFAVGLATPAVMSVEMGSTHVDALTLHLWANALFWGFLAVAIGATTGNRTLASGIPTGGMILSYVSVGLLPLVEATADLVHVLPWYWFDGHDPLNNGLHAGYLSLQLGSCAAFLAIAFVRVRRRDLRRPGNGGGTLIERLREHPLTARITDRLAGSARVTSIGLREMTEGQAVLIITSAVMFLYMGVLMGPMYAAVSDTLVDFMDSFPEDMLAIFGGGDLSTPEGWFQTETYGLMAPIAVMAVTILRGSRGLAGEERERTIGLLLANPVSRSRVVLEKFSAMVSHAGIVGTATFAGVATGSLVAGLGMSIANIAAITALSTLLGIMFGTLALAIGAATGSVRHATMGAIALAAIAYAANSFLTIAESLEQWAVLSPFHWYLGADALVEGMHWGWAAVFGAATAVLLLAALRLYDRRDLRTH